MPSRHRLVAGWVHGDGKNRSDFERLLAVVDDKQQLLRLAAAPWIGPALFVQTRPADG